jgi:predicted nucleotidyltransferase
LIPELTKDLYEFVALLVERQVEFVIVGAFALAFHGHPRYTGDIDFLVRNSKTNATKLEAVIAEFGFASTGLTANDFYDPDVVIQLGQPPNRIDLLTKVDGVEFDQIWENRVTGFLAGLPVSYISLSDFLQNKHASGRPKDVADVAALEGD